MDDNKRCINLLVEQLKSAHGVLDGTFEGAEEKHAHYQPEGSALSVGAAYAHAIFTEDAFVAMLTKGTPLFAESWKDKTGFSEPMPAPSEDWEKQHAEWAERVKTDVKQAKEYAKVVYEQTEKYFNSLTDDRLADEIDLSSPGMENKSLSWILSNVFIGHDHNLAGEVSAIKGVQGLKGYPF